MSNTCSHIKKVCEKNNVKQSINGHYYMKILMSYNVQ